MQRPRIVILANSLGRGKSRLQQALGTLGRYDLMTRLLRRSYSTAIEYAGAANCSVVSHCDSVLEIACSLDMHTLRHSGEGGLNGAAGYAITELRRQGACDLLLMATDMPRLRAADLREVAREGTAQRCVVIGADRHGTGTNLLFIPVHAPMRVSYGAGSLQRHMQEGYRTAGKALVYRSEEVGFDIDTPEDLREWQESTAREWRAASAQPLREPQLRSRPCQAHQPTPMNTKE